MPASTNYVQCGTDSPDMVVQPSTGASRYHNYCIDGGISPEYFLYTLVLKISFIRDSEQGTFPNLNDRQFRFTK
jgi:hypothetical protein